MRKTDTKVPVAMREAPSQEICKAWRKHFQNKIQWTGCRGTRKAHLNARWVELFSAGEYATVEEGIAWWDQTFAWCAKSKVLREMKFFELEWLISPGNFDKTMEGRYHD